MNVSLLTAGKDPHYALGLLETLVSCGIQVDFISNNEMQSAPIAGHALVRYLNFRGDQRPDVSLWKKVLRIFCYYWRLICYVTCAKSQILHILWFNKFECIDNTLLLLYYKALRKRIVYTAHNVSTANRDNRSGRIDDWSLRFLYRHVDHIIIHTNEMKKEIMERYGLESCKLTVVPFPVNQVIPKCCLSRTEARKKLKMNQAGKILLFFGNIAPYKGLEDAILALDELRKTLGKEVRLLIVGRIKDCLSYWQDISSLIRQRDLSSQIEMHIDYIPDEEVGLYFRASDIVILPYRRIYQSGVLFLAYNQGIPVIATDVGALKDSIVQGETGFVCTSKDPSDLADKIRIYFESPLYQDLESRRESIVEYVNQHNSWTRVGEITCNIYRRLNAEAIAVHSQSSCR